MNTHAPSVENGHPPPAGGLSRTRGGREPAPRLPESQAVAAQRKLQERANESPRVRQLKAMHDRANQRQVNDTGLPDNLKAGVEALSGQSLDGVRVHYDSPMPAQMQAHAFAQGGDIHVAPGMERHLPHEAWHVVQQAQGRVKPTLQMRGGTKINDDPGLEKEADRMGAKALHADGLAEERAAHGPVQRRAKGGVIQNVLVYKDERFASMKQLAGNKDAFSAYMAIKKAQDPSEAKLKDPDRVYDLENGLVDVTDQHAPVPQEDVYEPVPRALARRDVGFAGQSVYNVALDEGAGFLATDGIEILGTEGLSGCVAVMVQSRHEERKGYLLAHVDSKHAGKEDEIREELDNILEAVSALIQRQMSWADFDVQDDSPHQITLVRAEAGGEERLYIDMVKILRDLGASMFQAVSPKVFIDIGSPGNEYGAQTGALLHTGDVREDRTAGYGPVTMRTQLAREVREVAQGLREETIRPDDARVKNLLEALVMEGVPKDDPLRKELDDLVDDAAV